MGAGKTTIGKQLAKALHLQFIDSDREIEARTGVGIPLIFELEGEAGFRKRERAVISELSTHADVVLATGGGAVLDPENRADLKRSGFVVYLCADVESLVERTAKDTKRPLLQTDDPALRIRQLLAIREPIYRGMADLVVETGTRSVRAVVDEVIKELRARGHFSDTRA